ncbi:MAG: SMC-Scp complex subunit ScpB [Fimbriimonadia bacterium]|nr:SMC-Scp complex subunit ScpB [Fimbriimonadia bacterium]
MIDQQRALLITEPLTSEEEIENAIESLLFVSEGPVSLSLLAEVLQLSQGEVKEALTRLRDRLQRVGGLQLLEIAEGYQLATQTRFAPFVARLLSPPMRRLSRSALETLAIIAYEQPVTQAQIDALRGVDSSHTARMLIERGFVEEVGRKQTPGRPLLYGTTAQFLHYFGLNRLEDLPKRESDLSRSDQNGNPSAGL